MTSQMREIRTSGSVGARGEQSPWATRPFHSQPDVPFHSLLVLAMLIEQYESEIYGDPEEDPES